MRVRFDEPDVAWLLTARRWGWPVDLITEHAATILGGDAATPADIARRRSAEPG